MEIDDKGTGAFGRPGEAAWVDSPELPQSAVYGAVLVEVLETLVDGEAVGVSVRFNGRGRAIERAICAAIQAFANKTKLPLSTAFVVLYMGLAKPDLENALQDLTIATIAAQLAMNLDVLGGGEE